MSGHGVSRRGLLTLSLTSPPSPPDFDEAGRRTRRRWDAGAHALLRALEPLAAAVCDAAEAAAGRSVLDVGTGDGNVALEAGRRGAAVRACDPAPSLLAAGRARAASAGLGIDWSTAGAEALPYPDASFDAVVSVLGAALATRSRRAGAELLRVLRRDGVLVLAVPARRSLTGRVMRMCDAAQPPPDGVRSPVAWSDPDVARRRIAAVAPDAEVEISTHSIGLEFGSPEAAWKAFAAPFGLPGSARDRFADVVSAYASASGSIRIEERWLLVRARRGAGGAAPHSG